MRNKESINEIIEEIRDEPDGGVRMLSRDFIISRLFFDDPRIGDLYYYSSRINQAVAKVVEMKGQIDSDFDFIYNYINERARASLGESIVDKGKVYDIVERMNIRLARNLLFHFDWIQGRDSLLELHESWLEQPSINNHHLNLEGIDLRGAYLGNVNLEKADLVNCMLYGADFGGTNLKNANLADSELLTADFSEADLQGSNLERIRVDKADFSKANLEEATLRNIFAVGANFRDSYLRRANLEGGRFDRANLQSADLQNADLREAALNQTNLEGANLEGANLTRIRKGLGWHANLFMANLRGCNLKNVDLSYASLWNANLQEAELEGANLRYTNLRSANFSGANMRKVDVRGARNAPIILTTWLLIKWWISNLFNKNEDL